MRFRAWWRRLSGADSRAELRELARRVRATPLEDAVRQVEAALAHREKFRVVASSAASMPAFSDIAPIVARFLEQYSMVNTIYGDVTISHELTGRSNLVANAIRIGDDGGHFEILLKPSQEEVYVCDGSEDDPFENPYPSVYHYLLEVIAIVHPELTSLPDVG